MKDNTNDRILEAVFLFLFIAFLPSHNSLQKKNPGLSYCMQTNDVHLRRLLKSRLINGRSLINTNSIYSINYFITI